MSWCPQRLPPEASINTGQWPDQISTRKCGYARKQDSNSVTLSLWVFLMAMLHTQIWVSNANKQKGIPYRLKIHKMSIKAITHAQSLRASGVRYTFYFTVVMGITLSSIWPTLHISHGITSIEFQPYINFLHYLISHLALLYDFVLCSIMHAIHALC